MYGTAGSFSGQRTAKECGCLQVFNHAENSNEELVKLVKKRVGGIDLLVESRPENLQSDLAMMNPGGRVILLGPHEEKVQLYLRPFLAKEVYLSGINLANAKVNDLFEVSESSFQRGNGLFREGSAALPGSPLHRVFKSPRSGARHARFGTLTSII